MKIQLPDTFKSSMLAQLGKSEYADFEASLYNEIPVSIRINTHKYRSTNDLENVAWCNNGYYLHERPIFTLDPSFHAGAYYVQEASSMFIHHILENIVDGNKDIKVLDLSAAPGGKSTLIANFLNNQGLLVANEIIKNRAYTLKYNISKEGFSNVIVTHNEPKDFTPLADFFDIILVDAPCSGEGMFRKDPNAINEWSPESVQHCSLRQQNILQDVLPALKPGGHLIYSTCTYNEIENIDNVNYAMEKFGLNSLNIAVNKGWNVTEVSKGKAMGYQFYPHKTKGEGFFVALLQKEEESKSINKLKTSDKVIQHLDKKVVPLLTPWVAMDDKDLLVDKIGNIHLFHAPFTAEAKVLSHYLRLIYCGTTVGILNKTVFIPDHSLALSLDKNQAIDTINLSKNEALLYLKRELPQVNSDQKSWLVALYEGNGIGWLKNLGNRINNYLPAEYRIIMAIS
jgi:NOL1/NOP2/sun family putative RNA methylase